MRAYPSAAPEATPSKSARTERMAFVRVSASTIAISVVPGFAKHTSIPAARLARTRASAPLLMGSPFEGEWRGRSGRGLSVSWRPFRISHDRHRARRTYRIEAGSAQAAWDRISRRPPRGGRAVAVKVLRPDLRQPELRQRFAREARALATLSHPSIVGSWIRECRASHGVSRDGRSSRVRRSRRASAGPVAPDAAPRPPAAPVGARLRPRSGLVHRDVKPANVFLGRPSVAASRSSARLRAREVRRSRAGESAVTRAGQVFGTPAYMAPEQVAGQDVDARADVYAAGIVSFEMLTGRQPFHGDASEVLRQHVMEELPVAELAPGLLSPELVRVLVRARERHGGSASRARGAMLAALDAATRVASPTVSDRSGDRPRGDHLARRRRDRGACARIRGAPGRELERPEPASAGRVLVRLGIAVAVLVSLAAVAAAASVVYVLVTPERAAERHAVERLLPHPSPSPLIRRPAGRRCERERGSVAAPSASVLAPASSAAGASSHVASAAAPSAAAPIAPGAETTRAPAPRPLGGDAAGARPARREGESRPGIRPSGDPALHQYNAKHVGDARGHLLLARAYTSRKWFKDAVSECAIAVKVDDGARGDPRMLRDSAHPRRVRSAEAAPLVVDVYGGDALPAVDRALRGGCRTRRPRSCSSVFGRAASVNTRRRRGSVRFRGSTARNSAAGTAPGRPLRCRGSSRRTAPACRAIVAIWCSPPSVRTGRVSCRKSLRRSRSRPRISRTAAWRSSVESSRSSSCSRGRRRPWGR